MGEWHYVDSEDFEEYLKGVQIIQIHVIVHKCIQNIELSLTLLPRYCPFNARGKYLILQRHFTLATFFYLVNLLTI
jgi:hypothetical protein